MESLLSPIAASHSSEITNKLEKGEKKKILLSLLKEDVQTIDWKIEMSVLNRLLKKYPDLDFWRTFSPGYRVNSLRWFMGEGEKSIRKYYGLFNLDFEPKEKKIVGDKKVGEDYIPAQKKIVSLMEFLKQ